MTSLMNMCMFAMMALASDIAAIYLAGITGMFGIGFAYLTMTISYPCVIYLDLMRQDSKRMDCICCLRSRKDRGQSSEAGNFLYRYAYKPVLSTLIGRLALLAITLAILIVAVVALPKMGIGLGLSDFFPRESVFGQYVTQRDQYFPVWPVELNWGEVAYEDPEVQMRMAYQFEKMIDTPHIAGHGLSTGLVWTAGLAVWMLPCSPGMTCGPHVDPMCKSTIKPNTMGLKLIEDGGVCSDQGCPVIEGLNQSQLAMCLKHWSTSDQSYDLLNTAIVTDANGLPNTPIRFSSCSGNSLFAYNLRTTDDYVA